jgi:UrcA family protein
MEKNTRKSNLPAIAFALAALTATPAIAQGANSVRVPYGDLNLASQSGIAALDRRLDRAVERVCGNAPIQDLSARRRIERCRTETWQSIQDDRQVAIARSTGQQDVQRAERESRGDLQVSLAE